MFKIGYFDIYFKKINKSKIEIDKPKIVNNHNKQINTNPDENKDTNQ